MNKFEAWQLAKHIEELCAARTPWPKELFETLRDNETSDLVAHYAGLAHKARKRALTRDVMACEDRDGSHIECGEPYDKSALAPKWYVSRWNACCDGVTTRYYVIGEKAAQHVYAECAPQENYADYSPTGRWFRGARSMRHVRGNVWLVTSHSAQDV